MEKIQQNFDLAKLGDLLVQTKRNEKVDPTKTYKLLGVRSHGKGLFVREQKVGSLIRSNQLNRVKSGEFIYNRLFAWRGSFGIVPTELDGAYVSNEFPTFAINKNRVFPEFLDMYFKWQSTLDNVLKVSEGTTGISRNRLKEKLFLALEIPLPPLEKQQKKAAQLKTLQDRLAEIDARRAGMDATKVRDSILNAAFKGRLVRQDPDDEPAIELLAKIKEDYQKQKQQRNKRLLALDVSVLPALPKSWTWAYLGDVARVMDIDHKMPKSVDEGVLFISPKDFVTDGINLENAKRISRDDFDRISRKCKPEIGDIIYSRIGAALGRARKVPLNVKFHISYSLCLVRPHNLLRNNNFLYWLMRSPFILNQARAKIQSIGVPDLGLGEINKFLIPLAPLNEQYRIATTIEQLYAKTQEINKLREGAIEEAERLMPSLLNAVFRGQTENKQQSLQTSFQSSLQI
jgi:type I restriction enzyme S subunit